MKRLVRFRQGIVVCLLACSAAHAVAAADVADFASGRIPAGWTVQNGEYRSPEYSNAVDRIELRYSGADAAASATVRAFPMQQGDGTTVATLTAASSGAAFDFPEATDFRSFRIAAESGLALYSFAAHVSPGSLETPSGVTVSNNTTGTSFDSCWNAVDGATGYRVYVWTNAVAGASAGTAVWQETMPGVTNGANNTMLDDAKFAACFANPGWTRSGKAGYSTDDEGVIRIGTTSDGGWIQSPAIDAAADGMAVRFCAKAGNEKIQRQEHCRGTCFGRDGDIRGNCHALVGNAGVLCPIV